MSMATAKQIAARKRFAEMAKSGKLATMRKKAAKKAPAKHRDSQVEGMEYYAQMAAELKAERAARKKNPAPKKKVQTKRGGCNPTYAVQVKKSGRWVTVANPTSQAAAETVAKTLHDSGLTVPIRVWG